MAFLQRSIHVLTVCTFAIALGACGGGGGSGSSTATVSGTAATGAAIALGTVTLKCVSGTTTATTTGTDGHFAVDISGATLPCLARVEFKNTSGATVQLHSVITAAGTANITPLTDLLVAKLSGSSAAAAYDGFTAAKGNAIDAAQLKTATDAVKTYLVNLGVDVTNLPTDLVKTAFIAKTGSSDGDAFDKLLDAFKTKLGSKSLAEAEAEIIKTSTSTGGVGCTGDALAFFTKNAGTYPSTASSFGGSGTVAGIANVAAASVVIGADCTVKVGDLSLAYKDASLSQSGGGQIDVSLAGTNSGFSTYEVYGDGTGLTSLNDTRTNSFMNFSLPKK
jgi:hypothetical protein